MIDKAVGDFLKIAEKYFYKTTKPLDWAFFMKEVEDLKKKYAPKPEPKKAKRVRSDS